MVLDTYHEETEFFLFGFLINSDTQHVLLLNAVDTVHLAPLLEDDRAMRKFLLSHPDDRIFYLRTYVVFLYPFHLYTAKIRHLVCQFYPM